MKEIYNPTFVEKLFDNMSSSYARMNYITSFGFSERWRRQCVEKLCMKEGTTVVDLMTGMGECWKHILKKTGTNSKLIALDFSTEMIQRAARNKKKFPNSTIELLKENVFENSIPNQSADYVISGFGLKTFNDEQLKSLAKEIQRILKPNGKFSLIDVSVPKNRLLSTLYLIYLKYVIPVMGRLFLGNPETYKMLGVYTEAFGNAKNTVQIFERLDLKVDYVSYFYGCATGIKGSKA
jgi:demethylmenaquinone methyltransferase/2-methoxy-6-polyprenyl-1,4-benzoquinol methylase